MKPLAFGCQGIVIVSEELLQTIPQQIGKYTYYRLGSTTLGQLAKNGIIPKKNYEKLALKKPDGLVAYHGAIVAVVEYKQPSDLSSLADIAKAIAQEIEVAKALCKILIVTDGSKSFWVNAKNGDRIRDIQGQELRTPFHPFPVKNTATIEYFLEEVEASITGTESVIRTTKVIDPTPLAKRLWQTIWVATGKSPVKCLYNVVELFIFKFLSDLNVLADDISFSHIYKKSRGDTEEALEYYAKNTRSKICKLFPVGEDGTTIINGTIFVTERGEPNLSQSTLFAKSLEHLQEYSEDFGSLTKINKQFKTKLYESFLQQEVEALGQYFTPRKVVQSVIRMAGLNQPGFTFSGKRICDPFCGVGGFLLELLNMNEAMRDEYTPGSDRKIDVPFTLHGFDKGFERDDERTIILAKANMLIYLAELLFKNPKCSKEFAKVFNSTFRLFKDNLGTFGHIIKSESEKYDFILSNPPYVTKGSSIIKEELRKTERTVNEYPVNGTGLEGISVEWIIKSLKKGGRAFLILPDGTLGRTGDQNLREYILRECYLDAIVSLPHRTFFANNENTYIVAITKKNNPDDLQADPVFTYLVSNIGERLSSVKREDIAEDDLPEMENLFRIFLSAKGAVKKIIEAQSARCKLQPIDLFRTNTHWVINRWWSRAERVAIGVEEEEPIATKADVDVAIAELNEAVADHDTFVSGNPLEAMTRKEISLGDESLVKLFIGKRLLKGEISKDESKIPAFSANAIEPMGYVEKSNVKQFIHAYVLWGIDNSLFNYNLVKAGKPFATTDHCGAIQIINPEIVPEYLVYALCTLRNEETFGRTFRSSLTNMRQLKLPVPVDAGGKFDVAAQQSLATRFTTLQTKRDRVQAARKHLDGVLARYLREA